MPRPQKIHTERAGRLQRAMVHYEISHRKKLSKLALATMAGTTSSRLVDFQNGASLSRLRETAAVLGVSPEWLEHGINPPPWEAAVPPIGEPLHTVTLVGAVTAGDGLVSFESDPRPMRWKSSWAVMGVEGTSAYPVVYPGQFVVVDTDRPIRNNNIVVIQVDNSEEHAANPKRPKILAYLKRWCIQPDAPHGYTLASINSGRDTPYIRHERIIAKVPVVGVLFEDADKIPTDDETVEVL